MTKYNFPRRLCRGGPPARQSHRGRQHEHAGFIGVIPDTIHLITSPGAGDTADVVTKGFKFVDFNLPAAAAASFVTTWSQFTQIVRRPGGQLDAGPDQRGKSRR